jgi:hypothetical protein
VTREARCPAADPVSPPVDGDSVVCGVIRLSNEADPLAHQAPELVTTRRDPSSFRAYCTGRGMPSDFERDAHGCANRGLDPGETLCYTDCPVWRMERERLERAKHEGAGAELQVADAA